jgi:hypothetical protein
MFTNFARCFVFLLGVKPFCSVFSHFACCFAVPSVFSILLGVFSLVRATKIMNINSRSRLDCTFLLGPTKTQNPNMHSQLDYRISVGTRKAINQKPYS